MIIHGIHACAALSHIYENNWSNIHKFLHLLNIFKMILNVGDKIDHPDECFNNF